MRLLMVVVILLGFPAADLYATLRFAQWTGVPVWIWLSISVVSGLLLLRNERTVFRTNVLAALHGEQSLLRGVVDSGRKVLAGLFLLLPGVVSDLIAVALLMLPINTSHPATVGRSSFGRRESLEGEYRRLE